MSEPMGPIRNMTLHWTAGSHTQTFDDYHFCVLGSGQVVQTRPIGMKGGHTWKRNGGNIGISMCAKADGYPVTDAQRESTARLVAELAGMFGLDLHAKVLLPDLRMRGDQLIPTGRTRAFGVLADHAAFARADGYYPDRWDVGEEFDPISARAKAFRAEIRSGKRENTMIGKVC